MRPLRRSGSALSLLLIDVDHFKVLNDSAGHQRGDQYLVRLSQELADAARLQVDVVARIGGEEFALILPATMSAEAYSWPKHYATESKGWPFPIPLPLSDLSL